MLNNCILVIITWYFFVNPCIFAGEHTKTEKHILFSTMSFVLTNAPCVTTAYAFSWQIYPFIKQDGPDTGTNYREDKEIFEISAKGAIIFIIVASVFLLLLFYFMSSWFIWVLIVLFCIGGIEVFPPFRHRNSSIFVLVHVWYVFFPFVGEFSSEVNGDIFLQGMHVCLVTLLARYQIYQFW